MIAVFFHREQLQNIIDWSGPENDVTLRIQDGLSRFRQSKNFTYSIRRNRIRAPLAEQNVRNPANLYQEQNHETNQRGWVRRRDRPRQTPPERERQWRQAGEQHRVKRKKVLAGNDRPSTEKEQWIKPKKQHNKNDPEMLFGSAPLAERKTHKIKSPKKNPKARIPESFEQAMEKIDFVPPQVMLNGATVHRRSST